MKKLLLFLGLIASPCAASQIVNPYTLPANISITTVTWTNNATLAGVSGSSMTSSGSLGFSNTATSGIIGTTAADNAGTGLVGEAQRAAVTFGGRINAGTSTHYVSIATITLTAGDWDVTGLPSVYINGATITEWSGAISAFANDTNTDLLNGDNAIEGAIPPAGQFFWVSIPNWRVSVAATTSIYVKAEVTYTGGPPQLFGRISARRVR